MIFPNFQFVKISFASQNLKAAGFQPLLAIMNAKGADEVKSFLSRQSDVYRDPYAVFPDDRPPAMCIRGYHE